MKTTTHLLFRIDVWDGAGNNLTEHLAGLDDYTMAVAAYWAAVTAKPKENAAAGRAGGDEKLEVVARARPNS
jgi:hypothetical protein